MKRIPEALAILVGFCILSLSLAFGRSFVPQRTPAAIPVAETTSEEVRALRVEVEAVRRQNESLAEVIRKLDPENQILTDIVMGTPSYTEGK